jgi:hypothetical protein
LGNDTKPKTRDSTLKHLFELAYRYELRISFGRPRKPGTVHANTFFDMPISESTSENRYHPTLQLVLKLL